MSSVSRATEILAVAHALGGGITMPVIYALRPDVEQNVLRRTVQKMRERGALRAVPCSDLGSARRVYLTTRGVDGRASGVQKMLDNNERQNVVLPEKFAHNLIAAQLTFGLGEAGATTESELWRARAPSSSGLVKDGVAEIRPDWRVEIEVEMMVHQSPARWAKKGGLVARIAAACRFDNSRPTEVVEMLVVAPLWLSRFHPDSEVELDAMVRERAAKNFENRKGAGWWFLDLDRLESDPVWHPISPRDCEPPNGQLLGLASRRDQYRRVHEKRAALDTVRKANKRAEAAPGGQYKASLRPGTLTYEESLALEIELGLD